MSNTDDDASQGSHQGGAPPITTYVAAGTLGVNAVMAGVAAASLNPLPLVAGAAACPSSGYVLYQNKKLGQCDSIREMNNQLSEQSNRLAVENAKLKQSVDMLEGSVNRLKAVEESLGAMAEQQGSDVNKLTELVKENQKTIDEMKRLMKGKISQSIISTVLKCDDGDFKLDDKETDILCLRLRNIEGVTFKEDEMRRLIKERDGSLHAVMAVVRDLLGDNPTGPTIFEFDFDDDDD